MPRDYDQVSNTDSPSRLWRSASYQTILAVAVLCRSFLFGLNRTEVHGLPRFLELLKSRSDYKNRRRGLVTVSNHLSVLDDPLLWGVLPLSFAAYHGHMNHRYTLGSHDIAFQNVFSSHFFTLGQTLPTHRLAHSPHGGPFQSTMTEAVRLLAKIDPHGRSHETSQIHNERESSHEISWPRDCVDPFSDISPAPAFASQPNDVRYYLQPSRYACNSYSWVHIFPEGVTHQTEDNTMRYFKWGVSRLILEPPECPDVVPIFIEGTDKVMHESRGFPRFLPRAGKDIVVNIGDKINTEALFGDLRKRWRVLESQAIAENSSGENGNHILGVVPQSLMHHPEAVKLRIECTRRIRDEVLKLRRARGYSDEDPKAGMMETWRKEGPKREGQMADGSWIKDT